MATRGTKGQSTAFITAFIVTSVPTGNARIMTLEGFCDLFGRAAF